MPHHISLVLVNLFFCLLLLLGVLFYKKIYPKKKINLLILLIFISIIPVLSIFRPGTYESGDLTLHTSFLINFYKNLQEGNLIPEWAGLLCAHYGCPIFLFEYTLPYYIAAFFHILGFSFLNSMKFMIFTSFVTSGIFAFLWLKEEFSEKIAFVGALFFVFAPYHLMDTHFRVSVGEILSFTFLPLIFFTTKKLITTKSYLYFLLNAIVIVALVLSHTSTTLATLPFLIIYAYISIKKSDKQRIITFLLTCVSIGTGLLISAYYWFPAIFEIKYTWTSKALVTDDFKNFWEYIYSPVLFGLLFQGHHGELRLIVGYAHLFAVAVLIVLLYKRKIKAQYVSLTWFGIISFFILFILINGITRPIWHVTPFLSTFVMPWRLLVPISLITALCGAIFVSHFPQKKLLIAVSVFVIGSTILNWGNRGMVGEDFQGYITNCSLYTQYIEPGNPLFENHFTKNNDHQCELSTHFPSEPMVPLKGEIEYKQLSRTSTKHQYIVNAKTDATIRENTFYFPGWQVYANNMSVPINYSDKDNLGVVTFNLKKGLYKIDLEFGDTFIRKVGKFISLITLLVLSVILILRLFKQKRVKWNGKK